jgi:hypothetical protein
MDLAYHQAMFDFLTMDLKAQLAKKVHQQLQQAS